MNKAIIIGGLAAFTTGIIISMQAYLSGRAGTIIGPIRTGLWTNFLGGALAGAIILVIHFIKKGDTGVLPVNALTMTFLSGALGIAIIMGISLSIDIAGVAAGSASVFLGQMLLGVIADLMGWGGAEPIPLDPRRLFGLGLLAVSVYLLLPKK